jgi:hypothetical protein
MAEREVLVMTEPCGDKYTVVENDKIIAENLTKEELQEFLLTMEY